jgi:hypothetical protein
MKVLNGIAATMCFMSSFYQQSQGKTTWALILVGLAVANILCLVSD